jgi:hypothetical protein
MVSLIAPFSASHGGEADAAAYRSLEEMVEGATGDRTLRAAFLEC